jgi:2-iminobutanoate/2-iminopropanoate deaminase
MNKRIICTDGAPAPIGPYSQAVVVDDRWVYTSGQIAMDPASGALVDGDVAVQTRRVLDNLKAVLAAAGSGLEKVVKTTVFLADIRDFPAMNAVYGEYFGEDAAPARSTVQAARLPKDVAVEIDAVAVC